jgi:hypothetical protein
MLMTKAHTYFCDTLPEGVIFPVIYVELVELITQ